MKIPSERARLVLERYRAVTALTTGDKARLLEIIQRRGLHGDSPRFYAQASAPVAPKATPLQTLLGIVAWKGRFDSRRHRAPSNWRVRQSKGSHASGAGDWLCHRWTQPGESTIVAPSCGGIAAPMRRKRILDR